MIRFFVRLLGLALSLIGGVLLIGAAVAYFAMSGDGRVVAAVLAAPGLALLGFGLFMRHEQRPPRKPRDRRFDDPIPDSMAIFSSGEEVAGIFFRIQDAVEFAKGRAQSLRLKREPSNKNDRNAIKVIGAYRGWFLPHSRHIGYVSRDTAAAIAKGDALGRLQARLTKIWWGGQDEHTVIVKFDLLEPASAQQAATPKARRTKRTPKDSA